MDTRQLLIGLALSTGIGYFAYLRGSLTRSGWLGAMITGTGTFGFGGWAWGSTLVLFFVTSSALSRLRASEKHQIATDKFEKGSRRDLWQALANGGLGALLACWWALAGRPDLLQAAFVGVMATVTADTWATELGVLSKTPPRLITTLRQVAPGTSGGITRVGLLATAAGATCIGLAFAAGRAVESGMAAWWLVPAAIMGGVAGCLIDSLFGATLQAMYETSHGSETERAATPDGRQNRLVRGLRAMNNDAVNMLSSLLGGAVAVLVAALR